MRHKEYKVNMKKLFKIYENYLGYSLSKFEEKIEFEPSHRNVFIEPYIYTNKGIRNILFRQFYEAVNNKMSELHNIMQWDDESNDVIEKVLNEYTKLVKLLHNDYQLEKIKDQISNCVDEYVENETSDFLNEKIKGKISEFAEDNCENQTINKGQSR